MVYHTEVGSWSSIKISNPVPNDSILNWFIFMRFPKANFIGLIYLKLDETNMKFIG